LAPQLKTLALQSLCHVVLDFLDGMKPSSSLEKLTLKYNQLVTGELSRLCRILSKYPNLKELDLSYNRIEFLDGFVGKKLPSQLRRLDLRKVEMSEHSDLVDWGSVCSEEKSTQNHHRRRKAGDEILTLLKLLEENPMLWEVGGFEATRLNASLATLPSITASVSATASRNGSREFLPGQALSSRSDHLGQPRRKSLDTPRGKAVATNPNGSTIQNHPLLAEHMLDVNRSGRSLFRGKGSIPLSVWPLVLGRVNQIFSNHSHRQANAMFYMLRNAHDMWQHVCHD
jgi:hypothetical protein